MKDQTLMSSSRNGDWVDNAVREQWIQTPGIGVNAMKEKIVERCMKESSRSESLKEQENHLSVATSLASVPDPSMITKARVKHSQAFIPYRCLPNSSIVLSKNHQILIETKLQERMAYRAAREFRYSDEIQKILEAMGVELDDRLKTWTTVKEPPSQPTLEKEKVSDKNESNHVPHATIAAIGDSKTTCQYCHKVFPSRNHVFRHLRDPTSGCGTAIFASGGHIEEPPSAKEDRRRKEELMVLKGKTRGRGRAARHASADSSLWIGDLPFPWTNPKKQYSLLRSIFYQYLPRNVPTPWIKKVTRKGYRKDPDGVFYGWAIVVFRDATEAKQILDELNGRQVDRNQVLERQIKQSESKYQDLKSFILRIKAVDKGDTAAATWNAMEQDQTTRVAGQDPPLIDQLRPLDLEELRIRLKVLESKLGAASQGQSCRDTKLGCATYPQATAVYDINSQDKLLSRLIGVYSMHEGLRILVRRQGRLIPTGIRDKLLRILESLRWPARNERAGLASERYLVLQSNVSSDRFYGDLREACRELMYWADPDFFYSGIAVTKNFVASPHIDHRDESFQYAVSLGSFGPGGELCVEGTDSSGQGLVNVVTTQNRIARVDGRHVHYVRTWEGGDRYSLIFYDTSDRHQTPVLNLGVDESFLDETGC